MTRPESPLERAERIGAELRAATQEAAGLLKDLRAAIKDARVQIDSYIYEEIQAALNAYTEQVQTSAQAFHDTAVADLRDAVERAGQRATESIAGTVGIDHLCKLVAVAVAEMTVYVNGEAKIDLNRPIDWDRINEIQA